VTAVRQKSPATGEPAWGDYNQHQFSPGHQQAGTTESKKVVEALEKNKFDGGRAATCTIHLRPPAHAADVRGRHQEDREQDKFEHLQHLAEVPAKDEAWRSSRDRRETPAT